MTTFAVHEDRKLADLEQRARRAWGSYRENLVGLAGVAYDEAERAEWEHLQTELREIAAERATVKAAVDEQPPAARASAAKRPAT